MWHLYLPVLALKVLCLDLRCLRTRRAERHHFWISLPFLMFCRTVLYLDPQTGVKDHCWKLGFTVACHLGPTGALRIPLCEFDEIKRNKVHQAQQRFCEQSGEFEVLKVQENSPTGELPQSRCFVEPWSRRLRNAAGQPWTLHPSQMDLWKKLTLKVMFLLRTTSNP